MTPASAWINLIFAMVLGIATNVVPAVRQPDIGLGAHGLDQRSVTQLTLGIRHVRDTLYWSLLQDAEYRRDWETGVERALQAGLDPLIVVHQAPLAAGNNATSSITSSPSS